MRHYPRNSAEAAARLVALTMVADGHLAPAELDVLDRLDIANRLGLDRSAFHGVLQALCEDLLAAAQMTWSDSVQISPATLQALLQEVDHPPLRQQIAELCLAAVAADAYLAEGESRVLDAMQAAWGLPWPAEPGTSSDPGALNVIAQASAITRTTSHPATPSRTQGRCHV